MRKQNKMVLILVLVITVLLVASTVVTLAYFSSLAGFSAGSFVTSENNVQTVTVNSFYDLERWAKDEKYLSKSPASVASARYVLQLNANILFTKDLYIDRDVSIALNGKNLDLQTYNLSIAHDYTARTYITAKSRFADVDMVAGSILGNGKIYYSTPNAVVVFDDSLKDESGNLLDYFVLGLNEALTVKEIRAEIDRRIGNSERFIGDVSLLKRLEPYPYEIVWTAGNKAQLYLDNATVGTETENQFVNGEGRVTMPSATDIGAINYYSVEVKLDFKILTTDGVAVTDSNGSGEKTVVLLSKEATNARIEEGVRFLTEYFESYRESDTSEVYELRLSNSLVSYLKYLGISFLYKAKEGEAGTLTENSEFLSGNELANNKTLVYPGRAADIRLHVSIQLDYYVDGQLKTQTVENAVIFRFISIDGNNANAAQKLMDGIGAIIFRKNQEFFYLLPESDYALYNIKSITYTFENNNGNYVAEKRTLNPDDGKEYDSIKMLLSPSYEEKIYLNLNINFKNGAPSEWDTKTQVYYVDPSMGGGETGDDAFAYYHYLATSELRTKTFESQTYVTFTVPNIWLLAVEVKYYLDKGYGDRLKLEVSADGNTTTFKIDRTLLTTSNETVKIKFKYRDKKKDVAYSEGWDNIIFYGIKKDIDDSLSGEPRLYQFELLGIYKKDIDISVGLFSTFYTEYNTQDLDEEEILTSDEINLPGKTSLIIGNLLEIISFKGLELLTNITDLTIDNTGFGKSQGDFGFIVKMSALEKLSITNASLYGTDLNLLRALNRLKSLVIKNADLSQNSNLNACLGLTHIELINCNLNNLKGISSLVALETLKVSNAAEFSSNKNVIRRFDGLYSMNKLKEITIFANVIGENPMFGAMGDYNISALTMLSLKGVKIYREATVAEVPILFDHTPYTEHTNAVEAVVYSRKVKLLADGTLSLQVPSKVFIGAGTDNYGLEWKLVANPALGTYVSDSFKIAANGWISGTVIEIAVRVATKNNVAVSGVWRVIEIEVAV